MFQVPSHPIPFGVLALAFQFDPKVCEIMQDASAKISNKITVIP